LLSLLDLAKNTFLGFVAGNGVEHISSTIKEFLNSKGQKKDEIVLDAKEEG
jgi:hypothetical protein